MPKPVTPHCGAEVFVVNEQQKVLLIRRSDNGFWALPGGAQDMHETPAECAVRECFEESGIQISLECLLGVWSSLRYEYVNYPWKENVFVHLLFYGRATGGVATTSDESLEVGWFTEGDLPQLSDGHGPRIAFGFAYLKDPLIAPHFE